MMAMYSKVPAAEHAQGKYKMKLNNSRYMHTLPGESEHEIQAALIHWSLLHLNRWPCLKWLHANANGTYTTPTSAARAKAEGVKKGVADMHLPEPVNTADNTWHGLWIELKTKTGSVKPEQWEFIHDMRAAGYAAEVCRGFDQARQLIEDYLAGTYTPSDQRKCYEAKEINGDC